MASFTGTSGNDILLGTEGNDSLAGMEGDDLIDGAAGIDTASYLTNRATFSVQKTSTGVTVADLRGTEGVDTLQNMERVRFADRGLTLDMATNQNGGQAALLIGAVLGKAALSSKLALTGSVLDLFDHGSTLQELSGAVMRLPIWGVLANNGAATASNSQIASYLLTTVNGQAPDTTTLSNAVTSLDLGPQGDLLWKLALSSANQTQIGLSNLASTGLEFGFNGLAFSTLALAETSANDGSLGPSIVITLTGDSFAGKVGAVVGKVAGAPSGLVASLTKTTDTTATLILTGAAKAHGAAANVNTGLSVTFAAADFVSATTTDKAGLVQKLSMSFVELPASEVSGELLVEIIVPKPNLGKPAAFQKFGLRKGQALALVNAAAAFWLDDGKDAFKAPCIALGAVAPVVIRAPKAEAFLVGCKVTAEAMAEAGRIAASEAKPISDFRASADYRRDLIAVLVKRALSNAHARVKTKTKELVP